MNKALKFFILIIILTGLLFAYYYDTNKRESDEILKQENSRIFKFNPGEIRAVELNNEGNSIYVEKGENGNWKMLEPLKDSGDNETIEKMLISLIGIKSIKDITSWEENLSAYGLDSPSLSFKLYGSNSDDPVVSAEIGLDSVLTSAVYVKVANDPNLHYVSSRIKNTVKRTSYELREKNLIKIPPGDLVSVEIQRRENKFLLEKKKSEWLMKYPVRCKTVENSILNNVHLINSIIMKKVITENPESEDLKKYNLVKPPLIFKAIDKDKRVYEVKISKIKDDRGIYLFSNNRKGIYYCEKDILPQLAKTEMDLRQRKILPAYIHDMGKVVLKNQRGEITFLKDKSRLWWGYVEGKKYPLNAFNTQRLFAVATSVKAESFINHPSKKLSDYGLSSPRGVFSAFDIKGKKLGRFFVGKLNKGGIKAYCMNEDSKEIAVIDMVYVRDWFGREPDYYISKIKNGEENGTKK